MLCKSNEAAIDQIVASCNGDIRGALKALLLVNEHLEAELQQVYAAVPTAYAAIAFCTNRGQSAGESSLQALGRAREFSIVWGSLASSGDP
jgi:hypothetical protein